MTAAVSKLVEALDSVANAVRWAGALARRMRHFNIALENKATGSANTDALTLADLMLQELLISALRDGPYVLKQCRIEAEETTGDLERFATESPYTIALDPIDGTKQYRDKTGNGYAVILTLRSVETVHYTLIFIPESGPFGTWVRVKNNQVVCGEDDPSLDSVELLANLTPMLKPSFSTSKKIYLIGFQQHERARAALVTQAGLEGVAADDCPGCLYELLARGEYAGSLIHTPNIYDWPASLHIARAFGGDAVSVQDGRPVRFENLWMDERAKMLRMPNIIATSPDAEVRRILCETAKSWNPVRYAE